MNGRGDCQGSACICFIPLQVQSSMYLLGFHPFSQTKSFHDPLMDCWPKALGRKHPVVWLQFISHTRPPGRRHTAPRAPRQLRRGAGPGDRGRTGRRVGWGGRSYGRRRGRPGAAAAHGQLPRWDTVGFPSLGTAPLAAQEICLPSPELQNFKYTFDVWRPVSSLFLKTALQKQIALPQMMAKVEDETKVNSVHELDLYSHSYGG